jgi:hypothetical protein
VTKRVSPMERIRAQIDDLFAASERPLTEILEDVGRLSVRLFDADGGGGRGGGVFVPGSV